MTVQTGQQVRPAKTLWDWMDLLVVPAALAVGGFALNRAGKRRDELLAEQRMRSDQLRQKLEADRERRLAEENAREVVLQSYLENMMELWLHKDLRVAEAGSELRIMARARTLDVLRRLDGKRKIVVVDFLHKAGLISANNTIISLLDADLRMLDFSAATRDLEARLERNPDYDGPLSAGTLDGINLSGAYLDHASLQFVSLREANLSNAHLLCANLQSVNLRGANLSHADLELAELTSSDLREANLSGAELFMTQLGYSDLQGAIVGFEELKGSLWAGARGLPVELDLKLRSLESDT